VVLFLIAAIIFGLDALLGFVAPAYGAYSGRAHALAFCLISIGLLLWHGGR
jgi:hypothetical protein